MGEKRMRRTWTSGGKLRIVLAVLDGSVEISELCRREGNHSTQYYGWKKQLQGGAAKLFADSRGLKPSAREQRLEAELRPAKDVIAEITVENLDLRKGSRIRGPRAAVGVFAGAGTATVHEIKRRSGFEAQAAIERFLAGRGGELPAEGTNGILEV